MTRAGRVTQRVTRPATAVSRGGGMAVARTESPGVSSVHPGDRRADRPRPVCRRHPRSCSTPRAGRTCSPRSTTRSATRPARRPARRQRRSGHRQAHPRGDRPGGRGGWDLAAVHRCRQPGEPAASTLAGSDPAVGLRGPALAAAGGLPALPGGSARSTELHQRRRPSRSTTSRS